MFLRRLAMKNYSVFKDAELALATTPDQPIVLISANNGGGKTSTLSAFRLALHGRRSFDIPMSEKDYSSTMMSRFHENDFTKPCVIELDFDFLDLNRTRSVQLRRSWRENKQRISEDLTVIVDGDPLKSAEADDFLFSIVPPEIARYFFFDAERIKEMAAWDDEDEAQLFDAVEDLLGIQLLGQLNRDLHKMLEDEETTNATGRDFSVQIMVASTTLSESKELLRLERANARRVRGSYDKAVARMRRLGGSFAEDIATKRERLATIQAEHRGLVEEAHRAAHDILPLICGRRLRDTLGSELERRRIVDDRETVSRFLGHNKELIDMELKTRGISGAARKALISVLDEIAHGKPISLNTSLPNLSRTEESWMQRVVERELPSLHSRIREIITRLKTCEEETINLETMIHSAPIGDPKGEEALRDMEVTQRALIHHEENLSALERSFSTSTSSLDALMKQARLQRVAAFQNGRLALREQTIAKVIDAIPELQSRLQSTKQDRFAQHLFAALGLLWNKQSRLSGVVVDFQKRAVELHTPDGPIAKADLSSAEKQLFATAFIYSLSRLSGRHMPFVIDTPVGRLDREHRRRFIATFLPEASHQTILLSTDTEIVGSLYNDVKPFIAHHYDLSDYNGAITQPVQLALA